MRSATKILTGLLLAAAMTPAMAQKGSSKPAARPASPPPAAAGSLQQGQIEAGGNLTWLKFDAIDVGIVTLGGGYMFTDQLEARLDWSMVLGDASGGLFAPGVDYYIPVPAPVMPYVGGNFALAYGDLDDLTALELHAGVKQFLTERVALDYRLRYFSPLDSDFDPYQIMSIGFTYYL